MGFNIRYIDKEKILQFLNEKEPLSKLFSSDALIFLDDISSEVYAYYSSGANFKEIWKLINNED